MKVSRVQVSDVTLGFLSETAGERGLDWEPKDTARNPARSHAETAENSRPSLSLTYLL